MRKRATALLGVALAFVLGATVALASHQFGDVPTDSTFHEDIDWLVTNGITNGCEEDPPLYCPTSAVTRGQLAAFLHRYDTALGQTEYGVASIEVTKGEWFAHPARRVLDPARVAGRRHDRRRVPHDLRCRRGTLHDRCEGGRAFGHRHRRNGSLPPARVGDEGRRHRQPALSQTRHASTPTAQAALPVWST